MCPLIGLILQRWRVHYERTHQMLSNPGASDLCVIDRFSHLNTLLLCQRYVIRSQVFFQIFDLLRARYRENVRSLLHHPGQRQLARGAVLPVGYLLQKIHQDQILVEVLLG